MGIIVICLYLLMTIVTTIVAAISIAAISSKEDEMYWLGAVKIGLMWPFFIVTAIKRRLLNK